MLHSYLLPSCLGFEYVCRQSLYDPYDRVVTRGRPKKVSAYCVLYSVLAARQQLYFAVLYRPGLQRYNHRVAEPLFACLKISLSYSHWRRNRIPQSGSAPRLRFEHCMQCKGSITVSLKIFINSRLFANIIQKKKKVTAFGDLKAIPSLEIR